MSLQKIQLRVGKHVIPAKVYLERRYNVRASIGRKAAILRMPSAVTKAEAEQHFEWFKKWLDQQIQKNPDLTNRFYSRSYLDGDLLEVGERTYQIKITVTDRKTHTARLQNKVIHLQLSKQDQDAHLQKSIKHLLSRTVAQDFLPEITRRVHELNTLHFRKPIKQVFLKYNQSNWGSCSSQNNINLSTRLLFAPQIVIDYVIIHELAHLVEMNHSARFWELVAEAMPDYKKQEQWLKVNRDNCNF